MCKHSKDDYVDVCGTQVCGMCYAQDLLDSDVMDMIRQQPDYTVMYYDGPKHKIIRVVRQRD